MAVIIDTFEVINDGQAQQAPSGEGEAPRPAPGTDLKPADIESVLAHQQYRQERVRAH